MQFVSLMTDGSAWRREVGHGRHLPYVAQVDAHSLETRDGLLLQVIQLGGLLFETSDGEALNYRKDLRAATLQAIGNSRFALYQHVVRRRVGYQPAGRFPDPFSQSLDDAWRARLDAKQLYTNDIYLTLVRRSPPRRRNLFTRSDHTAHDALRRSELRSLDAAREALMASYGSYAPRLLGLVPTADGTRSEPIEFLHLLLEGERRPIMLPPGPVGDHLARRRTSFGQDIVEQASGATDDRSHVAMLAIKGYPARTSPGMLDELLRLPFELTLSQSFAFVDRGVALGRMNLALRRMRAVDDEAVSLLGELGIAKDEVAAGRAAFGEHHLTVALRGRTPAECDEAAAEVTAALADLGVIATREEIALESTFWAQFPGNFKYITRRALISTRNFASLASSHNFASGHAGNNHWGPAVTLLETTAAGPYHFNFHHGDLGNFTVIGPSGSGKTVVVNFLLAQALRFDPRIVFFDKDRGAELFIRAISGRYDVLRPGVRSGLNPLLLPDTPGNRRFLIDWVAQLAGGAATLDEEELAQIRDAVDANYRYDPALRRLGIFIQLFRGDRRSRAGDLHSRLRPWCGEGDRAWLFDNMVDEIDPSARIVGFDMTQILDDPALRTAAMMYLFHRVEERLDGTPSIIVVDEGWKALDDDVFVRRIKDWEKTIRKRNGIVGFATQSAQDALSSRIASAIVEQAATQIFMANPKAQAVDYMGGFGLSAHEFELVRTLPDDARCVLIRHGAESVVARLNLAGEGDLLTVLSGRERTVRLLDEIRAERGDDPAEWLPVLLERAA